MTDEMIKYIGTRVSALLRELRYASEEEGSNPDVIEETLKEIEQSLSATKNLFMLAGHPSAIEETSEDHNPYMPDGRRKKVLCVELKKIYDSAAAAHRDTGVNSGNLHQALRGNLRTAGGYHWMYIDPDLAAKGQAKRSKRV